MARAGARRKQNVRRYPKSGAIVRADRGERPEQIMAVALAQPHRRGEKDPRAGFAFGRMWLGGWIDERQYDAANAFTRRAVRYHAVVTGSLPRYQSCLASVVSKETGSGKELEPEVIAKIRSDYGDIQDALADAGMLYEANGILMRVCVLDYMPRTEEETGAFRCALNVIANRLRM
jgi:RNase P/RNase MRP subunit POP5